MKLDIKRRTLGVFTLIALFTLLIATIGYLTLVRVNAYKDYADTFKNLTLRLKDAKKAEKEFIEFDSKNDDILNGTVTSNNLTFIRTQADFATATIDSIEKTPITQQFHATGKIDTLKYTYKIYINTLDTLFEAYKVKGFTKSGLEGELRKIIHDVEYLEKDSLMPNYFGYDRGFTLMLRRREKDFFLRKQLKYLEKFNKDINSYKTYLNSIVVEAPTLQSQKTVNNSVKVILPLVDKYQELFTKNVAINQKIGLSHDLGLNGRLEQKYANLNKQLMVISTKVSQLSDQSQKLWLKIFWICTIISMILILYVSYRFLKFLLYPLRKINTALATLSAGQDSAEVTVKTGNELEDVAENLNDLRNRITTAAEFSRKIGAGDLEVEYDAQYANDILAKAVIEMREKLKRSALLDKSRVWHTEGIATFSKILQEEKDDLKKLCQALVSAIVNTVDANQATIFVVNNDNTQDVFLERTAAYAYDRNKYVEGKVYKGQGLVGQVWQEQKMVVLKKVPDNYINITSGLGTAEPSCVVILPMSYNDELMGIVEIAAFDVLSDQKIAFLEELTTNIASTLSGVKVTQRTKLLLEESKMMQESLQAQEEEMRQNMEEMQATQDMMTEKENGYLDRVRQLEKQIRLLSSGNNKE